MSSIGPTASETERPGQFARLSDVAVLPGDSSITGQACHRSSTQLACGSVRDGYCDWTSVRRRASEGDARRQSSARSRQGATSQKPRAAPDVDGTSRRGSRRWSSFCSPYSTGSPRSTSRAARLPTNASTPAGSAPPSRPPQRRRSRPRASALSPPTACFATSVSPIPYRGSSRNSSGASSRGVRPISCSTHQKRLPGPA